MLEPGPLGRENKRPLLAQDPEPGAPVSPPPHLAPNVAAKGFNLAGSTRGGKRSQDLVLLALTHQTARFWARGFLRTPCEQHAVPGASPAAGFSWPNCARARPECIWRQKEFRGKRVTPRTAFHKLPLAEEGGAYSSPLCLALRRGPGLSLACSIGGKHSGFGGIACYSQPDRRCCTWKRGNDPLLRKRYAFPRSDTSSCFFFLFF